MKIAKLLILLYLVLISSLSANEPLIEKKKLPIKVALPLLQSIDTYAIIIGNGPTNMYAFIDPVCPRSRDFVEMVLENKKMQRLYTYHFFFYELERFHTKALIAEIYDAKKPLEKMSKVMLDKEKVQGLEVIPESVDKKMIEINKIAKKLDIYKRPYLFIVKPQKGDK